MTPVAALIPSPASAGPAPLVRRRASGGAVMSAGFYGSAVRVQRSRSAVLRSRTSYKTRAILVPDSPQPDSPKKKDQEDSVDIPRLDNLEHAFEKASVPHPPVDGVSDPPIPPVNAKKSKKEDSLHIPPLDNLEHAFEKASVPHPPIDETATVYHHHHHNAQAAPHVWVLPPLKTFETACKLAKTKANYSTSKTLVLAFLAGGYIALGGMLLTVVSGGVPGEVAAANPGLHRLLVGAIGLPAALCMAVSTGCEVFTGNTFVMAAGFMSRRVTLAQVLRNWALVYGGNIVGGVFVAAMGCWAGVMSGPSVASAIGVATTKTTLPFGMLFARGILCNWMIAVAVWLSLSAQDALGKYVGMFIPVSTFTAMGMENSVANFFLIPQGIFLGATVSWSQFIMGNLLPVTLGNIVGGAVYVAGCYHLAYGRDVAPPETTNPVGAAIPVPGPGKPILN